MEMRFSLIMMTVIVSLLLLVSCGTTEPTGTESVAEEPPAPALATDTTSVSSGQVDAVPSSQPLASSTAPLPESTAAGSDEGGTSPSSTPPSVFEPTVLAQPGLEGYILFAIINMRLDGTDDLYVMRADGSSVQRLTEEPINVEGLDWRGGTEPIIVLDKPDLSLIRADGAARVMLPLGKLTARSVSLLPDGTRALFYAAVEGKIEDDVYAVTLATGDIQMVDTLGGNFRQAPAQSPDGTLFATNCSPHICVFAAGSSEPQRLVASENGEPALTDDVMSGASSPAFGGYAWAPTGRRLAFTSSGREINDQICIYDFETENGLCYDLGEVTFSQPQELSWSPEGANIIFTAAYSYQPHPENAWIGPNLLVLKLEDGEVVQLTDNLVPASAALPIWVTSWEPEGAQPLPGPFDYLAPTATPSIDLTALDAVGALQAFIQARANNDEDTFGSLVEGMRYSPDELWASASEACIGVDASQFRYEDTGEACCTDTLVEYAIYDGETQIGVYTLHYNKSRGWRIAEGYIRCQ